MRRPVSSPLNTSAWMRIDFCAFLSAWRRMGEGILAALQHGHLAALRPCTGTGRLMRHPDRAADELRLRAQHGRRTRLCDELADLRLHTDVGRGDVAAQPPSQPAADRSSAVVARWATFFIAGLHFQIPGDRGTRGIRSLAASRQAAPAREPPRTLAGRKMGHLPVDRDRDVQWSAFYVAEQRRAGDHGILDEHLTIIASIVAGEYPPRQVQSMAQVFAGRKAASEKYATCVGSGGARRAIACAFPEQALDHTAVAGVAHSGERRGEQLRYHQSALAASGDPKMLRQRSLRPRPAARAAGSRTGTADVDGTLGVTDQHDAVAGPHA